MNKEFLNECFDVIEQIKLGSIIEITEDNEDNGKSKYRLDYIKEDEIFELTDLDEKYTIWGDGETIEDIKEDLMCSAIWNRFQKIRLL
jgi:chaperone required for assembly of F1-ATPase